jgi:hypothetical protein
VNSVRQREYQEREPAEFLNSAVHNLRKILERDPEISPAEIETVVRKLPLVLREMAPLLAQSNEDMPYPASNSMPN